MLFSKYFIISDLPGDNTCFLAIDEPNLTPERCEKKLVSYLATHSMLDPQPSYSYATQPPNKGDEHFSEPTL